jgi:hypothetical protein
MKQQDQVSNDDKAVSDLMRHGGSPLKVGGEWRFPCLRETF